MFLWVRLVISNLKDQDSLQTLQEALYVLPDGLDEAQVKPISVSRRSVNTLIQIRSNSCTHQEQAPSAYAGHGAKNIALGRMLPETSKSMRN
jgi:hypothetical protein